MLSHRAQRTAALINVLDDEVPAAERVEQVLREYGESGDIELSGTDLVRMRQAALLLRDVFAAEDLEAAVTVLNGLLALSAGTLRLTSHNGTTDFHPHLDRDDDAPWSEWFLASSCLALTVLIWDRRRLPGGVCASAGCRNVFTALGSGPKQRYCSRRCATRERVAAHRRARA